MEILKEQNVHDDRDCCYKYNYNSKLFHILLIDFFRRIFLNYRQEDEY